MPRGSNSTLIWHREMDRNMANSIMRLAAAIAEQRLRAADYGGGGAAAARGDQDRAREREKRELACSQLQRESREQAYHDGGRPNGSTTSAPPGGIQAAALASSGQRRCGIGRRVGSSARGSLFKGRYS